MKIEFPVIVKPRWGMGSIGVYVADNIEELNVFYEKSREIYSRHILSMNQIKTWIKQS